MTSTLTDLMTPLGREHAVLPLWRYATMNALGALAESPSAPSLGRREQRELAAYSNPRRRQEYLCGRVLAKQLISEQWNTLSASELEIVSRDAVGRATHPRIWHGDRFLPISLSIAHTERGALVAVCRDSRMKVGVDLTPRGPLAPGFARLWFTQQEQAWFDRAGSAEIGCFLWAAKEAVYKACNSGEPFDPTTVEILPSGAGSYRGHEIASLRLRSWENDGHVAVMAMANLDEEPRTVRGSNQSIAAEPDALVRA